MSNYDMMIEKLGSLTPQEQDSIGRMLRGEDEDDLIRRGDVYEALRDLRTDGLGTTKTLEFRKGLQRGLGQALGAVSAISRATNYYISGPGVCPFPSTTEDQGDKR